MASPAGLDLELPAERPGHAPPPAIAASREAMAAAMAAGHWRTHPAPAEQMLGGVRVLRFRPPGEVRGQVLHFHGGGYRLGAPEIVGPYAAALAERCGVEVLCPAYRLAPDDPFPAGVNDGLAVLTALAGGGPLFLSGDSAGGGLAASLAVLANARGLALAGLVLLSPWLDLSVSAASYAANGATDPLFSYDSAKLAADLYLQGLAADHVLASPLLAPGDAFPPTLISVGDGEVLLDDSLSMAERLGAAGTPVDLTIVPGMTHTAVVRGLTLPGSPETFERVAAFIDARSG
ncbi:MAG: alpha/beta hydrolase [Sphingobium sp.]